SRSSRTPDAWRRWGLDTRAVGSLLDRLHRSHADRERGHAGDGRREGAVPGDLDLLARDRVDVDTRRETGLELPVEGLRAGVEHDESVVATAERVCPRVVPLVGDGSVAHGGAPREHATELRPALRAGPLGGGEGWGAARALDLGD